MTLNDKVKNILWGIFAVALIAVFVVWFILAPAPEHIEDTNGADNHSLEQITEENIIRQNVGTRGTIKEAEHQLNLEAFTVSSGREYSSNKFTGVALLHTTTLFEGSDIYVSLANFTVNSGNFGFYIVFDGEIVGQVIPGEGATSEFMLENVPKTGLLEYVIAGESADFSFTVLGDF